MQIDLLRHECYHILFYMDWTYKEFDVNDFSQYQYINIDMLYSHVRVHSRMPLPPHPTPDHRPTRSFDIIYDQE